MAIEIEPSKALLTTTRNAAASHLPAKLLILAFAGLSASFATAQPVPLGAATSFGVLAASAITNVGPTIVIGDLGIQPNTASSVTGFSFSTPPGPGIVNGATHFADAVALQAQTDSTTAYNTLAGLPCTATIPADLGGLTLTPGVYCSTSSMGLTGAVTLDAQGDPAARFVFQVGSQLTTASNSSVNVINGAQSCNVYWQIGSSATLGTGTDFLGTLIALTSVTLNTGASADGRIIARNGAITADSGAVSVCSLAGPTPLPPTVSKSFSPVAIARNGVSTLTITLANPDSVASTLQAALVDTLPTGLVIATPPAASTTCAGSGTVQAVPLGTSVILSAGAIIPASGTCTVSVNVTSATASTYVNTIAAGALSTSTGSNAKPATASLVVIPDVPSSPLIAKSFSPTVIVAGATSTLTIVLTNPNPAVATLMAGFFDTFPAGVTIAAPANAGTTCTGTGALVAISGSSIITLPAGYSIPANGTCAIFVNVTSIIAGSYVNNIPAGNLGTSNGVNTNPAIATLVVTPSPIGPPPPPPPPPPPYVPTLPVPALSSGFALLLALSFVVVVARRRRSI